MQGRLLPVRGGPVSHLRFEEVVKAAQAKAHRDTSVSILHQTMAKIAEQEKKPSLARTAAIGAGVLGAGALGGLAIARRMRSRVGAENISRLKNISSRLDTAEKGVKELKNWLSKQAEGKIAEQEKKWHQKTLHPLLGAAIGAAGGYGAVDLIRGARSGFREVPRASKGHLLGAALGAAALGSALARKKKKEQGNNGLHKQAEGELVNSLRGTLASFAGPETSIEDALETEGNAVVDSTSPPTTMPRVEPAKGLGESWAPVAVDQAALGLHEGEEKLGEALSVLFSGRMAGMTEFEKQALLGGLLRRGAGTVRSGLAATLGAGRGAAEALAGQGGAVGRVGRFLQRPIRSPLRTARTGPGGVLIQARSPLGAAPAAIPPPIPGGPYRTPAALRGTRNIPDLTRYAKIEGGPVRPKGLVRSLLPGALMLGAGYGLYKGVPAAANWATQAASSPMAYNFGHQQFMYGYTPEGQAQF